LRWPPASYFRNTPSSLSGARVIALPGSHVPRNRANQLRGRSLTGSENFDRSVGDFDQLVVSCQQPQSAAAVQRSGPHAASVRGCLGWKWNAVLRTGVQQRALGWTRDKPQLRRGGGLLDPLDERLARCIAAGVPKPWVGLAKPEDPFRGRRIDAVDP